MRQRLVYVELKSGYSNDGPAWIGYGVYNRTGKTLYFNGQVFCSGHGIMGNYFSAGDEYWVSGPKKRGGDRLFGNSKIRIDQSAVEEYLELRGLQELPKSMFTIVTLDNTIAKEYNHEIQNRPL